MSLNSLKYLPIENYSTALKTEKKKQPEYLNTITCPLHVLLSKLFSPILHPCHKSDSYGLMLYIRNVLHIHISACHTHTHTHVHICNMLI